MKKFVFALLLLLPALATGAKSRLTEPGRSISTKPSSARSPMSTKYENGMFRCDSCVPKIEIKADGEYQKVTGHPYYDKMAVKIVDDHSIDETDKRGDKVVGTSKYTVSSDGKTLTIDWVDSGQPSGGPVKGQAMFTRVGKAPAGNAVSGSWRVQKAEGSENGLLFSYKTVEADTLSLSTPTGQSYTAKLGGPQVPYVGDPGITTVSLKAHRRQCRRD